MYINTTFARGLPETGGLSTLLLLGVPLWGAAQSKERQELLGACRDSRKGKLLPAWGD